MAVQARRTWADLRSELLSRLRLHGDPEYGRLRATRFLESAQYDLAVNYHHYELDDEDTSVAATTGQQYVNLQAGTFIVRSVWLRVVAGGAHLAALTFVPSTDLLARFDGASAQPERYTRHGDRIYFDTLPDAAYPLTIWRYKLPTAPDFAAGSPDLGRQWDERILELAEVQHYLAHGEPDSAKVVAERLESWLQANAQPLIQSEPQFPRPGVDTIRDRVHGGDQG